MRDNSYKDALLTRRCWAALVAAVPLAAQVASPPQPAKPSVSSPGDDVRRISDQLAQIEVPMSLEPAFAFHV